jgi:hypothetical protein
LVLGKRVEAEGSSVDMGLGKRVEAEGSSVDMGLGKRVEAEGSSVDMGLGKRVEAEGSSVDGMTTRGGSKLNLKAEETFLDKGLEWGWRLGNI